MARGATGCSADQNRTGFGIYHELMGHRVREILLVHTPYDAFIMAGDGALASKIANEYRGLNLSRPPRMTLAASGAEALSLLRKKQFDLVVSMPRVHDMDAFTLGQKIKKIDPHLPVVLLAHAASGSLPPEGDKAWQNIDNHYIWRADPDLLLALIKNVEDHQNVAHDTAKANVRVLLFVEDSPHYRSFFLPLLYKEIVRQTQAVLDESLNEEHRLLKMRARPKILAAADYTTALELYHRFQPYLFGVMADTRFPKGGKLQDNAGASLLAHIRREIPDLPLLLLSADPGNRTRAEKIPSVFIDKNSPRLAAELHRFFLDHLGFGDFVFRLPDNTEAGRASDLASFGKAIREVPAASLIYHASRNHFSNWVMARSEIHLAGRLSKTCLPLDQGPEAIRKQMAETVREVLVERQQGVVTRLRETDYDAGIMDFVRSGQGAMGGKATGLAFMAARMRDHGLFVDSGRIRIGIPKTLAITTDGFNAFIEDNSLASLGDKSDDQEIRAACATAALPVWLSRQLGVFIDQIRQPLVVRSSSVLEDAHSSPYAGLFSTVFLANSHPDRATRLRQLEKAVREVYASAFFAGPRAFAKNRGQRPEAGDMAIMLQQVVGHRYGSLYYPAISGVMQSRNYYPVAGMRGEDGLASIAMGLGKAVVEGEKCLRFCPKKPQALPQFSTVDDILASSQSHFHAIRVNGEETTGTGKPALVRLSLNEAASDYPAVILTSGYSPEDHQVRDLAGPGQRLLTFAQVLKYGLFPLAETLDRLIAIGRDGMGGEVEMEFAVDLGDGARPPFFAVLQLRPMNGGSDQRDLTISGQEKENAFIYSAQALGHGIDATIADLVLVDPASFDRAATTTIAAEISRLNSQLEKQSRPYLLIGPGRWGSNDPWLGIPVTWREISGARAIVELRNKSLRADPSQGTHFFQNLVALGIHYLTIDEEAGEDRIDWNWLASLPPRQKTPHLLHLRLAAPITLKLDGRAGQGVGLANNLALEQGETT